MRRDPREPSRPRARQEGGRRPSRRLPAWCLVAVLVAAPFASPAQEEAPPADEAAAGPAELVARGELLYRLHCRSCHGGEGRGDGPLAKDLAVSVADLTRLAADGEFPEGRLARVIDGRADVAAHGSREMPIWGLSLRDPGRDSDQEAEVAAGIDALVAYLRSIQATAPAD